MAMHPEPGPRDDGREFVRVRPREPHEKYHIERSQMDRGMDYFFAATKIRGMPNPKMSDYWRAGWRPVRADAMPDLSGLDLKANDPAAQEMIDLGIIRDVKPESAIIIDDLMLMTRPLSMSVQAQAEDKKRAEQQVDDHLRTITARSRRAVGDRATQVRRSYGPAAPDEALHDDEAEI